MTRIWSASKPVLHLAVGLKAILEKGDGGRGLLHIIKRGGWALEAIRAAEFQRTIGLAAFANRRRGFLKIDREKTIQVLPTTGFEELLKPD